MSGWIAALDPKMSRREHRRELAVRTFVESPYMEAVLKLVAENPGMELPTNTRIALFMYREDKARAERAARIESGDENEGGE